MSLARGKPALRRLNVVLAGLAIALAILSLFLLIVIPAPPKAIAMATGADGGAYQQFGERYRQLLAHHGVKLNLVPTQGSVENVRKLNDASSKVSVAFVQSGITTADESPGLLSLGTIFYEPVWLFFRGHFTPDKEMLKGKRLFLGSEGSGSRKIGMELIDAIGLDLTSARIVDLPTSEVAAAMRDGNLDAAIMVAPWESPVIRKLLATGGVSIVPFRRADAHVALRPHLSKLVVPEGVADLRRNRPPVDVVLVAPKTSLVVRDDLHPALQYLLLDAATQVHSAPGIFQKAGQFPAAEPIDLPISEEARQYYRTGPPFLMRYLPFWMAIFAGRLLIILIPVIGVAFPLMRLLPVAYGWMIRRRIFVLY